MKKVLLFFVLFLLVIFLANNVLARSGCCSHHGGVCGCRCCDGTSLSATCAPYYPSCRNTTSVQKSILPEPKVETEVKSVPEYNPPEVKKIESTVIQGSLSDISKEDSNRFTWFWIIGIVAVAYFFYKLGKRKKDL